METLLSTESAVTSHVLLNPCFAVLTFLEYLQGCFAFSAGNVLSPGLREAEFSSMNSTVLGTMLPGFFVASMTPMCPISVCFLHGPGWHSPSALQFLTHAATDLPAKRMEKRSQGVVNIHPAYSVAGRWVGSDGVWVSR